MHTTNHTTCSADNSQPTFLVVPLLIRSAKPEHYTGQNRHSKPFCGLPRSKGSEQLINVWHPLNLFHRPNRFQLPTLKVHIYRVAQNKPDYSLLLFKFCIYIWYVGDDITENTNYRGINFSAHSLSIFLFIYALRVLTALFYANFRNAVERLNSPVLSVPPCIYVCGLN